MKAMLRAIGATLGDLRDILQLAFGDREAVFKRDEQARMQRALKRYQH